MLLSIYSRSRKSWYWRLSASDCGQCDIKYAAISSLLPHFSRRSISAAVARNSFFIFLYQLCKVNNWFDIHRFYLFAVFLTLAPQIYKKIGKRGYTIPERARRRRTRLYYQLYIMQLIGGRGSQRQIGAMARIHQNRQPLFPQPSRALWAISPPRDSRLRVSRAAPLRPLSLG